MGNCHSCKTPLHEDARFCHQCGTKVVEETLACPDCGAENGMDAKFCFHCGMMFFYNEPPPPSDPPVPPSPPPPSETPPLNDLFEDNPNENLEQEIADAFTEAFKLRIKTEHNSSDYNLYATRFNESEFKISFEFRGKQLAEEIQKMRERGEYSDDNRQMLLQKAFEELLDYFIIHYCADLNEVLLSERILKYQNIRPENINLDQMIADYLDFKNEEETVYTDFLKMPLAKLKNASQSFLFPEKDEKILFICDQSLLGSCKEGFAMTEKALYWKALFENPQRVYYYNLEKVFREEDWITINGIFFNISKSVNLKMMKLLKKLKEIVSKAE